jgi:hypothetical protein
MPTAFLTLYITRAIARKPFWGKLFGWILIVTSLPIGILLWNAKSNEPFEKMTVQQATQAVIDQKQKNVELTDVILNCDEEFLNDREYSDDQTWVPMSDRESSILIIGEFGDLEVDCLERSSKPIVGLLSQKGEKNIEYIKKNTPLIKTEYKNSEIVLGLCGFCGPGNNKIGLILLSVSFVMGFVMIPLSEILHKDFLRHPERYP